MLGHIEAVKLQFPEQCDTMIPVPLPDSCAPCKGIVLRDDKAKLLRAYQVGVSHGLEGVLRYI